MKKPKIYWSYLQTLNSLIDLQLKALLDKDDELHEQCRLDILEVVYRLTDIIEQRSSKLEAVAMELFT